MNRRAFLGVLGVLGAAGTAGCNQLRKAVVGPAMDRTVFEEISHEDGALVVELNDSPEMGAEPPAVFTVEGPITGEYRWPHDGSTTYEVTADDLGEEFMGGDYAVTAYDSEDESGSSHEVVVSLSEDDGGFEAKVTEVNIVGEM